MFPYWLARKPQPRERQVCPLESNRDVTGKLKPGNRELSCKKGTQSKGLTGNAGTNWNQCSNFKCKKFREHSDQGSIFQGIPSETQLWKMIWSNIAHLFAGNFGARLAGIVI